MTDEEDAGVEDASSSSQADASDGDIKLAQMSESSVDAAGKKLISIVAYSYTHAHVLIHTHACVHKHTHTHTHRVRKIMNSKAVCDWCLCNRDNNNNKQS